MLHPFLHHRGSEEATVQFSDVATGYVGVRVLTDINLTIMRGDFVGLLGSSGPGNMTLLRTILGATRLYACEIMVHGELTSRRRPQAGYVSQLENIDWNFSVTVEEAVMMCRTMSNILFPWYRRKERDLAYSMMERLGISHLGKRHIRELSGGQQYRVFIPARCSVIPTCCCLMSPPAVWTSRLGMM